MDNLELEKIKLIFIKIDNLNKLNLNEKSRLFIKEISNDDNFLKEFINKNGEENLFSTINCILENLQDSYKSIIESRKDFTEDDLKISSEIINEMFLNKNRLLEHEISNEVISREQEKSDQNKINEILDKLK